MNEMKPEDVMRALEQCGGLIDGLCKNCPLEADNYCNENLSKYALALLREKDAEIKELTDDNKWSAKRIIETDKLVSILKDEVERLNKAIEGYAELEQGCIVTGYKKIRADAITEFAERVKTFYRNLRGKTIGGSVEYHIEQIAKEMREKQ